MSEAVPAAVSTGAPVGILSTLLVSPTGDAAVARLSITPARSQLRDDPVAEDMEEVADQGSHPRSSLA